MKHRWQMAPEEPLLVERLGRELGLPPLLAQCLVNRGLANPAAAALFLEPRLRHLRDPALIPGMTAAVERLWQARECAEPIALFGDYDVDGVSATALLFSYLSGLGWRVRYYLPHRMDEGYGLTRDAAENCLKQQPARVLLAVDCGSTAVDTIAALRAGGVDVVVLDHHQCGPVLPPAAALVNPQLITHPLGPRTGADFTELCSVGLAFKLAHALTRQGRQLGLPEFERCDIRSFLDFVALGTVADLVPLTGENRILVTAGLQRLTTTSRAGLQALKTVAQVAAPVSVRDIGFHLGPRLNAAGRMETAEDALLLLLAETLETAEPLARMLDARNRERQAIEKDIVSALRHQLEATFDPVKDFVLVAGHPDYHIGVVGIVAARLLQTYYRPTFVLGGDGGLLRGSGRSIEGFDLAAALRECDDLLVRHGGHRMAAGVTLQPENLDAFRARLNQLAAGQLRPEQLVPPLRLDATVGLADLTLETVRALERLAPYGQQNPAVQCCVRNLASARAPLRLGADQQHLKLWVTDGRRTVEALWWGGAAGAWPVGQYDLAVAPQINTYNGNTTVQLRVLDWRPSA